MIDNNDIGKLFKKVKINDRLTCNSFISPMEVHLVCLKIFVFNAKRSLKKMMNPLIVLVLMMDIITTVINAIHQILIKGNEVKDAKFQ